MSVWLTQTVQTLSLAERETVLIPASVPSMPTAQEETTGAFAIASLDTQEILMATNAHLVRTFQKGCLGFFFKKHVASFQSRRQTWAAEATWNAPANWPA